jgi:hypothetical protein
LDLTRDHAKPMKKAVTDSNIFLINKIKLWMRCVFPTRKIHMHRKKFCL